MEYKTRPWVLCCPDKFRGTLTAKAAAAAMAAGVRGAGFPASTLPLADGGEGSLDALVGAKGGRICTARVTGPAGVSVRVAWGSLEDGTAVVEAARVVGLALVRGRNDVVAATTRGVGELISIVAAAGASAIVVCVGGSATVDGGRGAVDALGWVLPPVPVTVACDVRTAFLDSARIFGPQKGASTADVQELDCRLRRQAQVYKSRTGMDITRLEGAGAAGGLAGGLAALGARLRSGFDVIAEAVGFSDELSRATIVLTGEGRFDQTSLDGKVVGHVVAAASTRGRSCGVIAGDVQPGLALPPSVRAFSLVKEAGSLQAAERDASALVAAVASAAVRRLSFG